MNSERRFWAKVERLGPNDCWLWTAAVTADGFPRFFNEGRRTKGQVFSWTLSTGEAPAKGNIIVARCGNRICVNPGHLVEIRHGSLTRGYGGDLPGEEWSPIPGWNPYEASTLGRIRRNQYGILGKVLKPRTSSNHGYLEVNLSDGTGTATTLRIHRLIAETFLGEAPGGKTMTNHINHNKTDNRIANLEWISAAGNAQHESHLSRQDTDEMKRLYNDCGWLQWEIAKKYGVSQPQVSRILLGHRWA